MTLARNIVTTLSSRFVVLGLALVSSMFLARALGPEGRGLLALVLLLPEMARNFALLGFDQSNAVYAGLEPGRRNALIWQSVAIAAVVGSLTAALGIAYVAAGAPGFSSVLQGPLWMYVLSMAMIPFRMLHELWMAALRGMNRIAELNLMEVGVKVASLSLMIVVVVLLKQGVPGSIWSETAVAFAGLLVLAALFRSAGALGRPALDRQLWKRTAGFAWPSYTAGLMSYLNYRIDQLLIALLLPKEQLAFYVLAVEIAERLWIIPGSVGAALLPHLTHAPKRDPHVTALVARHAIVWTGAACLALWVLGGPLVSWLNTPAFAAAAAPLRWLLPGIFTLTLGKVLVAELAARERIRFTVWLMMVAAGLNVVLNLLLIPVWGITGAAMSSTITYTFVTLVIAWFFLDATGLTWDVLVPRRADLAVYWRIARDAITPPAPAPAPPGRD